MNGMDLTEKTLQNAIGYFQEIIDNPDKPIKISEPSFESQYIKGIQEGKIKPPTKSECPHCKFIETLGDVQSNREYWIMTEVFVYLHNGKDYCDWRKK